MVVTKKITKRYVSRAELSAAFGIDLTGVDIMWDGENLVATWPEVAQ